MRCCCERPTCDSSFDSWGRVTQGGGAVELAAIYLRAQNGGDVWAHGGTHKGLQLLEERGEGGYL